MLKRSFPKMSGSPVLATVLLLFCLCQVNAELDVIVSGSGQGNIQPIISDYSAMETGGLAQRASVLKTVRANGKEILLLEAGDFLFGTHASKAACETILQAYEKMDYDAINLGASDFRLGKAQTLELIKTSGLPVVSANLYEGKAGGRLFDPYVIVKRGGFSIAVIGITEPPLVGALFPHLKHQLEGVYFGSFQDALDDVFPEINQQADHVVVLFSGSAAGLKAVGDAVGGNVDVIACSGTGSVFRSTFEQHARLLTPQPQGRSLSVARLEDGKDFIVGTELVINRAIEADAEVKSVVESTAEMATPNFVQLKPQLESLPQQLPGAPERNKLYALDGFMSNRGADIRIQAAGLFDRFGELEAKPGNVLLVLRSEWENTIPLILMRDKGVATTYLIPNLGNHLYAVVNGKRLARVYSGKQVIPNALPTNPLSLPCLGMMEAGSVVFEMAESDEPIESIQLRLYDYAHGHDTYELLGTTLEPQIAELPVYSNQVIDAVLFSVEKGEQIADQSAGPRTELVAIDFWATSRFVIDGDATAFDPHAPAGKRIQIGTVADWLEADQYAHLVVDGHYAVKPLKNLNKLGANPRFLPDVKTGNVMVFQVPQDSKSLSLRADFPNALLPDGTLIRPTPIQIDVSGNAPSVDEKPTIWSVADDTMTVGITGTDRVASFAGVAAKEGKQFLVLDLDILGTGEKPEFFQAKKQLLLINDAGRKIAPSEVTFLGIWRPTETVWVPNGEHRIFQLVFEVGATESEQRFAYQGYALAENFLISSEGGVTTLSQELERGTEARPAVRNEPESNAVVEKDNAVDAKTTSVEAVADVEEPKAPRVALNPYHPEAPKAVHEKNQAEFLQRTKRLREGKFVDFPQMTYAELGSASTTIENQDLEQLDDRENAIPHLILIDQVYQGEMELDGQDFYTFEITNADAGKVFHVHAAIEGTETFQGLETQLRNPNNRVLVNERFEGQTAWYDFSFEPGTYTLRIENGRNQSEAGNYRLLILSEGATSGRETEWNDDDEYADRIEIGEMIQGRLSEVADEEDQYVVEFNETHQGKVYVLEAVAKDIGCEFEVDIYRRKDGRKLKSVDSQDGAVFIGNLVPEPGGYFLNFEQLQKSCSYQFQIRETGVYDPKLEREPNDNYHCDTLAVIRQFDKPGAEVHGEFEGNESDLFAIEVTDAKRLYSLTLAGENVEEIHLISQQGRQILGNIAEDRKVAGLVDMKLPLGLNRFQVQGKNCDWAVNIETKSIPTGFFEDEPNNEESYATQLQFGETYFGRMLDNWDYDYYKVVVHQAMPYRIRLKMPEGQDSFMRLKMPENRSEDFEFEDGHFEMDEIRFFLPGHYFMYLDANDPSFEYYELTVEPVFDEAGSEGLVTCEFDLEKSEIAAHSDLRQSLRGTLKISNTSDKEVRGTPEFFSNHDNVVVSGASGEEIELAPNESKSIPVQVTIEAETWCRSKVWLAAQLKDGDQNLGGGESTLSVSEQALPVGTEQVRQSELLPELVGGLNLGSSMLGAEPVVEHDDDYPFEGGAPDERYLVKLIDGVVENDSFFGHRAIIQLAGDGTIPLVGTSFDLHGEGSLWESVKDFQIELSDDGKQWVEFFNGTLDAKKGNQQFVFPSSKGAKYARLTLLNTQFEGDFKPHLGEWRMIGKPGVAIEGARYDLLNEDFGGHAVHGDKAYRVYGFHHDRAALVTGMSWQNRYQTESNAKEVKLSISMGSPAGPWKALGVFDVARANEEDPWSVEVTFEEPVWARFVKVEWPTSISGDTCYEPERVSLFEAPHSHDYYSVFAEWGDQYAKAGYEYLHPVQTQTISRVESSENRPYALEEDMMIASAVTINEDWEDWFEIPAQESDRRVQLDFHAEPFIKFQIEITDAAGNAVDAVWKRDETMDRSYFIPAKAGEAYRVHVFEPRRSIVFLWDVSGSMSNFVPSIENAIQTFAQAVNPKTEIVHLLPFEDEPKFLLSDWADDPLLLTNTVRYYDAPDSSYAHINLLAATEKLADQKGIKAAIVITDCESSRDCNEDLWTALNEVRPVVFTFQTSDRTSQYTVEQDDMQDWAAVGGGFYRSTRDASELDVAFEKVKVFLRRPAPYTIVYSVPELKPGSIQVVDARAKETIVDPTKEGVMLLIDASASMREALPDGTMKVTAAKQVIETMVKDYLPEGTNFGMRVFGHRGGENCKSELMLPLGPIEKEVIKNKLMFIRSSSLGNTSLAEGISWALEDFKGISGTKRLVVLTDGEETCHGDPAAEIAKLAEAGLDVVVNFVGFTLADESVKAEYSNWVQSTNGFYYDAQDSEELGLALQKAMKPSVLPSYDVLDETGTVVVSGTVGDEAAVVKSGRYTVKINAESGPELHEVEVVEDEVTIQFR